MKVIILVEIDLTISTYHSLQSELFVTNELTYELTFKVEKFALE